MTYRHLPWRLVACGLASLVTASAAAAQSPGNSSDGDPAALADGVHMHMLLEKTIFKVDVLTVDVWLGEADGRRIEKLTAADRDSRQLADSVAEIAIHSQDAAVRLEFIRDNVSLEQFVDGIRDDLKKVPRAGVIDQADYEQIASSLPVWFEFLADRKIRTGDQILYRISGDTLRTRYVGYDGQLLLDQVDVGQPNRLSLMGSYFVPGSSFREKLIRSLTEHPS